MTATDRITLFARIAAPPARIWAHVRRFGEVANWNPFLAGSRIVSGREGEIGAEREVTTKDGATAREQLTELDDDRRSLGYRMVTFPIPVLLQENRIVVSDDGQEGCAIVMFSADFDVEPGTQASTVAEINRHAFATAALGIGSSLQVAVTID